MLPQDDILLNPETVTLKDGTQVIIRPIHPDDAEDLQATFQRLSMESIYLRFLSFKKELPDEEARYLATVDYTTRMAFVAIASENNREIVVGVSRYAMDDPGNPEFAEFSGGGGGQLPGTRSWEAATLAAGQLCPCQGYSYLARQPAGGQ